jgi:hypothetical protein
MLRGLPHLTQYMPEPKDARRLIPDPENEPDFYEISRHFPLETRLLSSGVSSGGADVTPQSATMDDRRRGAESITVERVGKRPALTSALNPHVPVRGSSHTFQSESYAHPSAIHPSIGLAAFPGGAVTTATLHAHLLALQQQRHQQALQIQRQQHPHVPASASNNNPDAAVSALQAYLLAARRRNHDHGPQPASGHPVPPRGPPHFGGRGPTY